MTFADWQAASTAERQPAEVCFDRQAIVDLHRALEEFGTERQSALGMLDEPDRVTELAEQIKALDRQVQDATRVLWFAKIPLHRWSDIEAEHPATEQQKADDPKAKVDPDTFEPAIVAATCVDPGMTVDEAVWLRDFLPLDVWDTTVLGAVFAANKTGSALPKGVSGIADRLLTALKSISPAEQGSPSPSSEDES